MAGIDARLFSRAVSLMGMTPDEAQIRNTGKAVPGPSAEVDAAGISTGAPTLQGQALQRTYSPLEPGMLESAGAAVANWDTLHIWRSLTKPEFEPDTPESPDLYTQLKHTPFTLTEPENERLRRAGSSAERTWLLQQFEDSRQAGAVASEHAVVAGLAGVLDPAYLALAAPVARVAGAFPAGAAARSAGAVGQGAVALGVTELADDVAPMSTGQQVFMVLANMAGGATIAREGKLVKKDTDFPDALADTVQKPHMRMVQPARYTTDNFGNQVKVRDAVFEEIPKPLRADAGVVDKVEVATAIENQLEREAKTWGQKFGDVIGWNTNKTMRNLSDAGEEIADLLTDNNLKYGQVSAESIKIGVQRDLGRMQATFEQKLRETMAQQGFGTMKYLLANAETRAAQAKLEREIMHEMMRREQHTRLGRPITFDGVPKHIKDMADDLDKLGFRAVDELQAAGVAGAENIQKMSGYFHRQWSAKSVEDVLRKFQAAGQTAVQAEQSVKNLLKGALRRGNNWNDELAGDVAHAIVTRTLRKGLLDDGVMSADLGKGAAAQVRDMLEGSGLSRERINRVLEAITGEVDEAGKSGYLKHRVDLDYTAGVVVNGELIRVTDLIESNIATITDRYVDGVAAQVALARKGLTKPSDIDALRTKYIAGAKDRVKAAEMFDNVIAHLQGKPVGADMNEMLRNFAGFNRMITLGASGIWQATEYAKMMQRYGMLKTLKYMTAEMPGFKQVLGMAADPKTAGNLKEVLTGMSQQNLRMRPYIQRFEDNFEIPETSRFSSFVQQGNQLVPYLNGMKYIHGHQARVHANLVLDVLKKAAKGDANAVKHLKDYGLESRGMDKIRLSLDKHGFNVDAWDDAAWMAARPVLNKMVDESVLHARMGDMPAFALLDPVGKFIFTYRSFVLTAHNKILAGTSAREGLAATSLLMLYQYPLSLVATQANTVASGKPALNQEDLLTKSIGQMGALGLGGEISNIVFGGKSSFGSPGLIPADRAITAVQSAIGFAAGNTDGSKAAQDAAAIVPFMNLIPGSKALQHLGDE